MTGHSPFLPDAIQGLDRSPRVGRPARKEEDTMSKKSKKTIDAPADAPSKRDLFEAWSGFVDAARAKREEAEAEAKALEAEAETCVRALLDTYGPGPYRFEGVLLSPTIRRLKGEGEGGATHAYMRKLSAAGEEV